MTVIERKRLDTALAQLDEASLRSIAIDAGRLAAHEPNTEQRNFWNQLADCAREHRRQKTSVTFLGNDSGATTPDPSFYIFNENFAESADA